MSDTADVLREEIAADEAQLARKRTLLESIEELYGATPARRIVRRKSASRVGRATVRRGRALKAKALRTTSGRRAPVAPGSVADRIIEVLTEFAAPMKKKPLVEACKVEATVVAAECKRLRADGRIVMTGKTASVRYAVPKFANVIVAEE